MCGIVAILCAEGEAQPQQQQQQQPLADGRRFGPLVFTTLIQGLERLEYRGYDSAGLSVYDPKTKSLYVVKKQGKVKILKDAVADDLKPEGGGKHDTVFSGICHTRWATHGVPNDVNAHPHLSQDGQIAVVHNGIIENHAVLRKHLEAEGVKFVSQTDTEVLAHLIRHVQKMEPEMKLEDAVSLALTQVEGAFGIVVMDARHPNTLVGARRGSPLLMGIGKEGITLASDAAALVGRASRVVYLEDEDLVAVRLRQGEMKNGVEKNGETTNVVVDELNPNIEYEIRSMRVKSASASSSTSSPVNSPSKRAKSANHPPGGGGHASDEDFSDRDAGNNHPHQRLERAVSVLNKGLQRSKRKQQDSMNSVPPKVVRELHKLELSLEKIEKGGHKHFMIKEILEQPTVLGDCLRGRIIGDGAVKFGGLTEHWGRIKSARRIIITACGTSWHSALVAEYMIESLAKIPVEVEYASEFRYRNPIIFREDVVIVVSQSGETADTLEAVRIAKAAGAMTLGFVNVVGSSIARLTDAGAYLHVGPEIGVASTKAFTGQVTLLALFAIQLGVELGRVDAEKAVELVTAVKEVPSVMSRTLTPAFCAEMESLASMFRYVSNFLFLGRGPNMPVALEGALKMKEISYIHAEGYPAAELKHGPIALIDRMMPVVIIAMKPDATYEKVKSSIEEVVARQGCVIAITNEENHELDHLAEHVIRLPQVNEFVSPLITCLPLQLLAYYIAARRGCPIDQPRNLAKSVTVE